MRHTNGDGKLRSLLAILATTIFAGLIIGSCGSGGNSNDDSARVVPTDEPFCLGKEHPALRLVVGEVSPRGLASFLINYNKSTGAENACADFNLDIAELPIQHQQQAKADLAHIVDLINQFDNDLDEWRIE